MPLFKGHSILEIARGIKVFLRLEVGVVRGELPDQYMGTPRRKLRPAHDRIERQPRELERIRGSLSEKDRQLERLKSDCPGPRSKPEASERSGTVTSSEPRKRRLAPPAADVQDPQRNGLPPENLYRIDDDPVPLVLVERETQPRVAEALLRSHQSRSFS